MLCVVICGVDDVFFFFKQKTAYEMRISDWSSDVCSSDLSGSYAGGPFRTVCFPTHYRTKDSSMKKSLALLTAACASAFAVNAQAATKWDLPSAYPASNLHTQNLEQFVKEVKELSGGELDITLHSNASRSEENTSELQSLMRNSYAVYCSNKK